MIRGATYRSSSYLADRSPAGRAVAFAISLAIAILLILALLRMGGYAPPRFGDGRPLATFSVKGDSDSADKSERQQEQQDQSQKERATEKAPVPRITTPRTAAVPEPPPPLVLPGVMVLNRADYAASDIGKIKGTAPRGDALAKGGGAGSAPGDSAAIGRGPGGEELYAAEWYREPTRAETSPYMPVGKVGWGMVACRTADRYHVEDCVELGETPGSGIARGLRQAARQFLVRPPRKGGMPMIGAWVRIRFDLRPPKAADAPAGPDDDAP